MRIPDLIDILALFTPFIIVWFLAPKVPSLCERWGLIAQLTDRHAHKKPIPHGGGIVMIPVVIIIGLIAVWGLKMPRPEFLTALLLTSTVIAAVGLYDDKYGLSIKWRLLSHLVAVSTCLYFMPQLFTLWPIWLEKIVIILAWGWFINLYNFMDGLDGLATSQTVFIAIALAILFTPYKPLFLIIAGASIAFLRVNWMPAKVFLGDVGSTFLGYILGGLLLVIVIDDTWRLVYPLATIPLVFTADATYTLIKRIAGGHKPWEPHREFWIHRANIIGFSHAQIVIMVIAINLSLFAIVVVSLWYDLRHWSLVMGFVIVSIAAFIFKQFETKKNLSSASAKKA